MTYIFNVINLKLAFIWSNVEIRTSLPVTLVVFHTQVATFGKDCLDHPNNEDKLNNVLPTHSFTSLQASSLFQSTF